MGARVTRCTECGGNLLSFGNHEGGREVECLMCGRSPWTPDDPQPLPYSPQKPRKVVEPPMPAVRGGHPRFPFTPRSRP